MEAIYASGMITSPYGLHEIPHIVLPVTLGEFASHIYCHYERKLFERNIYLVPGIKTVGDDIAFVNNTRGEEIEALGALADLEAMGASKKIALILPGSHTHVILSLIHIFSAANGGTSPQGEALWKAPLEGSCQR